MNSRSGQPDRASSCEEGIRASPRGPTGSANCWRAGIEALEVPAGPDTGVRTGSRRRRSRLHLEIRALVQENALEAAARAAESLETIPGMNCWCSSCRGSANWVCWIGLGAQPAKKSGTQVSSMPKYHGDHTHQEHGAGNHRMKLLAQEHEAGHREQEAGYQQVPGIRSPRSPPGVWRPPGGSGAPFIDRQGITPAPYHRQPSIAGVSPVSFFQRSFALPRRIFGRTTST